MSSSVAIEGGVSCASQPYVTARLFHCTNAARQRSLIAPLMAISVHRMSFHLDHQLETVGDYLQARRIGYAKVFQVNPYP